MQITRGSQRVRDKDVMHLHAITKNRQVGGILCDPDGELGGIDIRSTAFPAKATCLECAYARLKVAIEQDDLELAAEIETRFNITSHGYDS